MDISRIKKFIIPTVPELVICLTGAVMIILVFYFQDILRLISQSSAVTSADITHTYQTQLEQLDQFSALRTMVVAAFWATVGLVAYVVYLIVTQTLTDVRNQVVISTEYTNRGRITSIILPVLIRTVLATVFFIGLWVSYLIGIPLWFGLFESLLFDTNWLGVVGILGLSLNLYILWLQFRLIKLV